MKKILRQSLITLVSLLLSLLFANGLALADGEAVSYGKFIELDTGVRTYYQEAGKGKIPIVIIPGWTCTSDFFIKQLDHYTNSDQYRFIAYDPRGQGRSEKTKEGNNYIQHARDLKALIDMLGLKDVVIGGWSTGVYTASYYLREFGFDNVKGIVFIDEAPKASKYPSDPKSDWDFFGADYKANAAWVEKVIFNRHAEADGWLDFWAGKALTTEERGWLRELHFMTPTYVAAALGWHWAFGDFRKDWKDWDGKIPVLQLLNSQWQPKELINQWIETNTPNSKVNYLPGGHMMFWTHPEDFNSALESFISGI
jgi:non-heme chloroperoxidase